MIEVISTRFRIMWGTEKHSILVLSRETLLSMVSVLLRSPEAAPSSTLPAVMEA